MVTYYVPFAYVGYPMLSSHLGYTLHVPLGLQIYEKRTLDL